MTAITAPAARRRLSIEALQQSRRARSVSGLVLAALVALIVWLIVAAFTGSFTDVVRIRAQLPAGSNAVPISAPVEYRNVTVGKVGSETQAPGGGVAVEFEIYPRNLGDIPKGVRAQVAPLSIFGNQYVDLVPPAQATTGHLEAGDYVAPYTASPSSSLQGTVTQLYDLLNAVHPAALDTALTAFAEALNGEGKALGRTLSGSADYLGRAVVPNLSNIESDLDLLAPVSDALNRSAPDVLGTLSNSATTAQTIVDQQMALHSLLTGGNAAVGRFAGILQQVQTSLPTLLDESAPLLADVTQNPDELAQTLSGLTEFAGAVAAQEQSGPFLSVNVALPVTDISAGVNAALGYGNPGSVEAALGPNVDPPTYSSANCPEYPGESNPYCGSGGSPDATPAGGDPGTVTALGAPASPVSAASTPSSGSSSSEATPSAASASGPTDPAEGLLAASNSDPSGARLQAAQAIAAALGGGQPTASPALAAVVLMPLLSSMAGQ